ncbi:ABC transporter permease subunit [Glaciibacter superstes]|uniref:ABC transporter permease subunit n=1 Tax=Glaciibacter superstes TaxID=501023 RepID=UPI0003B7930A|nr:ABC transporter permease subunit [Glaciibacter superstes]
MTTTTHSHSAAPVPAQARASFIPAGSRSGLTFGGILRSEWIKLWSVRSTAWSYAMVVLISLGMAAIMSMALDLQGGASLAVDEQAGLLVQASTFGVFFGQLVVAVLGVLVISGEYSTGMIKSTLTAAPGRLGALWGKAAVLFVTTFVVGVVATVGSFLVASPIMAQDGLSANLFDGAVILPLLGGALFLALLSVVSLGIGTILRSSAGGIAAALGVVLLLPIVLGMIPAQWAMDLLPYTISNAGMGIMGLGGMGPESFEPWQNLLIVLGWLAVSLAGAAILLKRRDA